MSTPLSRQNSILTSLLEPILGPAVPVAKKHTRIHIKGRAVVLGDSRVGKTSLLTWAPAPLGAKRETTVKPTVGLAYTSKRLISRDCAAHLEVCDVSGDPRYESINALYLPDAHFGCALVVFALDDEASLRRVVSTHLPRARRLCASGVIILVGTKRGASSPEIMTRAKEIASEQGLQYVDCDAKTGSGVAEVFSLLARSLSESVAGGDGERESNNGALKVIRVEKVAEEDAWSDREGDDDSPSRCRCVCC